jgi:HSP20 family protein
MPTVDVKDTQNEFVFVVELPGVNERDIEVEVVGDNLTIRGKREFSSEEKKDDYVRIERNYGSFLRTFALDVPVKPEKVTATFKDGLLTVSVPKAEGVTPRKVAVHRG